MNRKQRLLAWPGYGTIAKEMGGSRRMAIRGVASLERGGHMRVVRSRNGNNVNHYHPNVWATQQTTAGVVTAVTLGSDKRDTRVVTRLSPEPTNEPTREPLIRDINSEIKNGERGSNGRPRTAQTSMVNSSAGGDYRHRRGQSLAAVICDASGFVPPGHRSL